MRPGAQCVQEVKVLIRLRHPHLVRYLGMCTAATETLIVTELAPLGSLDNFLNDREGRVSLEHKLVMAHQICRGMAALAEQGLIHRDLAARNVLVFADAPSPVVKVTDFGLTVNAYGATHMSVPGEQVPFRWMPPEALRRRRFSEKSDVWAYGVTLWELLTDAEIPYALIPSDTTVAENVLSGTRLAEPPGCPPELWSVMQRCWEASADARPTFQELLFRSCCRSCKWASLWRCRWAAGRSCAIIIHRSAARHIGADSSRSMTEEERIALAMQRSLAVTPNAGPPKPPAAIAALVGGHSTAKAAVEAGVDREEIVKVAMEDGDVMAWLLATIPEYAMEEGDAKEVCGSSPLSRRSLASLSCVCASPSLSRRACASTHAIRVFCVCVCVLAAAPLGRAGQRR